MITINELIESIEHKIAQYRDVQTTAWRVRGTLRVEQKELGKLTQHIKQTINDELVKYQLQTRTSVGQICNYYQTQMEKQKSAYQKEVAQLSNQISRQYKAMGQLRQEVWDLMMLLNYKNKQKQGGQCSQNLEDVCESQPRQSQEQNNNDNQVNEQQQNRTQTINGLEVIQQQQTERTLLSSKRSFGQQRSTPQRNDFIRIEQKEKNQLEDEVFCYKNSVESSFGDNNYSEMECKPSNNRQQSSEECTQRQNQWESQQRHKKQQFQQLFDSNISKRHNTYQFDNINMEGFGQFQSLPINTEGFFVNQFCKEQFGNWEGKTNSNKELRDITNHQGQTEQQRQSKSKMFLQQFRKTFNKCLSSANVSRKGSKVQPKSKNNTSRQEKGKSNLKQMGVTFGKLQSDRDKNDNQKLINEMLKDIDNNNKFSVGSRRTQLKYEGQRRDNVRHGQGILYYSNGLCYEGQFKNNLRHGYGVLRFNQIQIYKGEWVGDQLSGQGKIRNFAVINKKKSQSTGSVLLRWVSYCGYFRNNRFQGQGTMYLQGGQKFLGKFICGMACGQGTLYKKSGEVETGIWRNNQLVEQF